MAAEKKKTPKTMLEHRFLDHIYDGYQAGQRYCFVLGAGAAKASGIRTGEEMMREWREYLRGKGPDYIQDCAKELGLKRGDYQHIFEDAYSLENDDYFTLFDLRFAGEPNVAYAYLEKQMEGKYPSYGYFPLAMLLFHTENRLVITTNFDTLLEDALYTYTIKHPLVVGHESLASYIGSDVRHPVIAKIHRDLLFRPFNRKEDMRKLKEEWEQPLRNALSRYIPIVIGYAGGDHTFMSMLQDIELKGIYWCHLGDAVSDKIKDTVAKHNGYLVKILGFDEIMFQIGDRFAKEAEFHDPCQYMQEQAEERCRLYRESLDKIKKRYETQKSSPGDSPDDGDSNENVADLIDAIERYDNRQSDREEENGDISRLEGEARKKLSSGKIDEALELYTQLITLRPDNAGYYERRSVALYRAKRYDEAVRDDIKAIELDPDNANYYHSRAVTLHAMGQYDQALEDRTKAVALAPGNALYYEQRSVTLHTMEQYSQALEDIAKAIQLDPDNAEYYYDRSLTLHAMGEYDQALEDRTKAVTLAPGNALYYEQRSVTLHAMGEYGQALEDATKAIELDPDNAEYYCSRGVTLDAMERYSQALEDITKAIELDANNASYYRRRAMICRKIGKEAEAEQDTKKAEEITARSSNT